MIGSDARPHAGIGIDGAASDWAWDTILRTASADMAPFVAGQMLAGTNQPLTTSQAQRLNAMFPCDAPPPRQLLPGERVAHAPQPVALSLIQASRREDGMLQAGVILNGTNRPLSPYEAMYLNTLNGFLPPFPEFKP